MSLNHIETLKTSIYNPKHTKNTKTHFNFFQNTKFRNHYSSKKEVQTNQSFMLICMALFISYVEGHTAELVYHFLLICHVAL